MAVCKECGEEADALETVRVAGKAKKLCEDCADRARETAEIAEQSEAVVTTLLCRDAAGENLPCGLHTQT